jgi:hypothetical protein
VNLHGGAVVAKNRACGKRLTAHAGAIQIQTSAEVLEKK